MVDIWGQSKNSDEFLTLTPLTLTPLTLTPLTLTPLTLTPLTVSINSDDPHLFGIDLIHEYDVVHRELGLGAEDFERINEDAAACSFLPLGEKRRVWPREVGRYMGSE